MNVDDVVAEKIAAARARAENAKRRRAALAAARQRGLAFRHAAKLRNQASARTELPEEVQSDDGDIVIEVSEAEFHDAVRTSLARLGLTYAELEDQARRRDFTSAQAQVLWVSIGGAVNTDLLDQKETS
ncbi:hypothetical protein TUSST3_76890 [Streptomyces sp. TUS-ST3]|uniref:hypothetical protein n=1 Tax=Streptomyces sp. TUS-ST3 TaxID=3025591 RepID=UPI00235B46F4|nr:hypothetical protein [Streptomyces sp. TUS-ST3]GLP71069.1 hypothetical protein TUSST3_76890 [Streptomyces sp. TUS-ST3]